MQQIVLIGMPRSGKSSCGQLVAEKLGCTFIDIDRKIEQHYSQKCNVIKDRLEIFEELGHDRYRQLESELFIEATKEKPSVIATAGGTPIYTPCFSTMTKKSIVVFLYCQLETLWERMSQESVFPPPYLDAQNPLDSFKEMYKSRLVYYLSFASKRVDATDLSHDEIVEEILELL